jgi:hypothetical protein
MTAEPHPIYGHIIDAYTREDMHDDGLLVDVTATAKEAGWKYPVALSSALMSAISTIPANSCEDAKGRLWDVLNMARSAAKGHIHSEVSKLSNGGQMIRFHLSMRTVGSRRQIYYVKAVVGPGDTLDPVVTMFADDEPID